MEQEKTNKTLSIIVPCFNEQATIRKIVDLIVSAKTPGFKKEIVIVDDGSTDDTPNIIRLLLHQEIKTVTLDKNRGKGNAVREGIKHATGDLVLIQDADLEYNPEDYQKLLEPISESGASVVYGSRILKKTNKKGAGLIPYLGGIFLSKLTNFLYNTDVTDVCTCYKVFDSKLLKNLDLKCTRFEFCHEVTARVAKRGVEIVEIPISYNPRSVAEGKKIKWRDGVEAIWTLIKYRFTD